MSTTPTLTDGARAAPNLWRFANVEFDERSFELRVGGVLVDVERAPLRVLRELLETPRELVSRERLLASVWKRKPETISRNALTNAIGKLRRSIGDEDQTLVVSSSGEGYRLEAEVERRALPSLQALNQVLKVGQAVPHRQNWMLSERIDATNSSEVWKVVHAKTHELRVFKFASDSFQLAALRREVTISRLLSEALGPRPEFVRIHDWNFDQPPLFIDSEYAGEDLRQWALRRGGLDQVPLSERLAVMAELADALALAHSVGALHKDLKPGNVAIQQDASGNHVRLLDFGSGRLLDPDILDQFQITRMALPEADPTSGTPFYIAPELLSGAPPTIASDIYALGVLLYQFVIGDLQKPIAPGWEAEVADPLLREDIALTAEGNPLKRLTSATELAQRLRDLPQRRQERSAALIAQQETQALQQKLERARVRRRWLRMTVAVLAVGLLSTLMLYFKLLTTQKQREAALVQAHDESEASRQVTAYVVSLFDAARPEKTGGKPIDPRTLVDQGKTQLEQRLKQQPQLRARMLATVGTLYCRLGLTEDCRKELEQAVTLQRTLADADPQLTAELLAELARAYSDEARDDDAERLLRESLAILESQPSTDRLQLADVLQALGSTLQKQQKTPEAIALLERARSLLRDDAGQDSIAAKDTLGPLAQAYIDAGRSADGLKLGGQLVEMLRQQSGAGDLGYLDALNQYGNMMLSTGDNAGTEKAFREVLAGYLRFYGADSHQVFDIKGNLSDVLSREGRVEEAILLTGQVVDGMRPKAGPDNPDFASALVNLGEVLELRGDYAKALPPLREGFGIIKRHFGDSNLQTWFVGTSLARLLVFLGRTDEALGILRVEVPASFAGDQAQFHRGRRLKQLGDCYVARGEYAAATESFDRAEKLLAAILPAGSDALVTIDHARGRLLLMQKNYAQALPILQTVAVQYARSSVAEDPAILDVKTSVAECLVRLGRIAEARALIEQIGPVMDRELAPTHRGYQTLERLRAELKMPSIANA